MSLEGSVALVTGGGRGVGRAIALGLAEDGATVAVNYRRDDGAASETVSLIEAAGGRAKAYQASVDDLEEDELMVNQILDDLGPVSILVHNAGKASRGRMVADTRCCRAAACRGNPCFWPSLLISIGSSRHEDFRARRYHHDFECRNPFFGESWSAL